VALAHNSFTGNENEGSEMNIPEISPSLASADEKQSLGQPVNTPLEMTEER